MIDAWARDAGGRDAIGRDAGDRDAHGRNEWAGRDGRDDDPLAKLERLVSARTHRMVDERPGAAPRVSPPLQAGSGTLRGAIEDLYGAPDDRRGAPRETVARGPVVTPAGTPTRDAAPAYDPPATYDAPARPGPRISAPVAPDRAEASAYDGRGHGDDVSSNDAELADEPPVPASLAGLRAGHLEPSASEPSRSVPSASEPSHPEPSPGPEATEPMPRILRRPEPGSEAQPDEASLDRDLDRQLDAQFDAGFDAELNDAVSDALAAASAALAATATQRAGADRPAAIAPLAVPEPPAYDAAPETAPEAPRERAHGEAHGELGSDLTSDPDAGLQSIEFGDDFERELVDELLQIEPPQEHGAAGGDEAHDAHDPLVAARTPNIEPTVHERPAPANDGGRRRGIAVAAMLGGVAVLGGLAAFSLGGGETAPVEVALIRAETTPAKVRPAEPGGRTVPNQSNAVYERVASVDTAQARASAPTAIVSKTEDVSAIREVAVEPTAPSAASGSLDKGDDRLASAPIDLAPRDLYAPRAVRTIQVLPDGSLVSDEPALAEPAADPAAPDAVALASLAEPGATDEGGPQADALVEGTPAPGTPLPRFRPGGPASTPVASQPDPTQPAPTLVASADVPAAQDATVVATDAAIDPATPALAPGGYVVQIASVPSADAARSTYDQLASRFGAIIGGRGVDYQIAEVDGKGTFHRVRVGATDKSDADATCSALKAAGGSCFVTR